MLWSDSDCIRSGTFLPSFPDLEQALGARTGKIKAKQLRMKVILVKDEAYAQPVSVF